MSKTVGYTGIPSFIQTHEKLFDFVLCYFRNMQNQLRYLLFALCLLGLFTLKAQDLKIVVANDTAYAKQKRIAFALYNDTNDSVWVERISMANVLIVFLQPHRKIDIDYLHPGSTFYAANCEDLQQKYANRLLCIPPKSVSDYFVFDLGIEGYTLMGDDSFDVPFERGKAYRYYVEFYALPCFVNCPQIYSGIICSDVHYFAP